MTSKISEIYGNRVRIRACGLLVQDCALLLINHRKLAKGDFWAPPGGGVDFGESAKDCLRREFQEETGLEIKVGDLLFTCEFIRPPLHAVELFFSVDLIGGSLTTGHDPEMPAGGQILKEARFVAWDEIHKMPPETLHGSFSLIDEPAGIIRLNGYHTL